MKLTPRPASLWLSRVDGIAQVWANGASLLTADGLDRAEVHDKPLTWDVTGKLRADGPNRVTVAIKRTKLAELGAGGLLGPVYLYAHC